MGRPRTFNSDKALEDIKSAFWKSGYEGTSMQDIETVTGLKKQSLYRFFGDKRQMYLSALMHYEENEIGVATQLLLRDGTAKERFKRLFNQVVDDAINSGDRSGCFLCNSSVDQAQLDSQTREIVEKMMMRLIKVFVSALTTSEPFKSDLCERNMKAAELTATYFGLRVLIKANAPEKVLRNVVKAAVSSL